MPANDVLYGFTDELRRQMTNLAPNQTIITDNNMNSYINNPESPEKEQPKPYLKTITILQQIDKVTSLRKKRTIFMYSWKKIQKEVYDYWKDRSTQLP